MPPYSSTTMATCTRLRWNSFSSSGTRLVSGTKCAGRISGVIGSLGDVSGFSRIRSLTNTKPERRCRASPCRPARASTAARGTASAAARRSRSASIADDVGARRHHLAHHRFAEVDQRAQQLARLPFLQRLGFRGRGRRGFGRRRLVGVRCRRWPRRSRRRLVPIRSSAVSAGAARGPGRRTTAAAPRAPARDRWRTISSGSNVLAHSTTPMSDSTSTGKPAASTPVTRASRPCRRRR